MNVFHVIFIVLATLALMEIAVSFIHRYVMHGPGWGWHRSHHEAKKPSGWERNDLYALVFTAATIPLFAISKPDEPLWWIATGVTAYGLLYALLHDVLIHRRLPLAWKPRNAYLQRLMTAHRLHHAVRTREGAVSYGFLYAPPVEVVRAQLRRRRQA
jgi:beta-carotene 3-hydroxylase